jgi:GNAT superfamily N-acetyltransferase
MLGSGSDGSSHAQGIETQRNALFTKMNIRPLLPSEWETFRDLRLYALQSAPGMFESTYAQAATRSEADWRALLSGERQQIFGMFDHDKLVGIAGVFASKDDPATAHLVMDFILPEFRGKGLWQRMYAARLDWVRGRKDFRRAIVAARESNAPSLGAMRAAGFAQIRHETHTWPDGVTEDEIWFELKL